jgi:hypothetical protein
LEFGRLEWCFVRQSFGVGQGQGSLLFQEWGAKQPYPSDAPSVPVIYPLVSAGTVGKALVIYGMVIVWCFIDWEWSSELSYE